MRPVNGLASGFADCRRRVGRRRAGKDPETVWPEEGHRKAGVGTGEACAWPVTCGLAVADGSVASADASTDCSPSLSVCASGNPAAARASFRMFRLLSRLHGSRREKHSRDISTWEVPRHSGRVACHSTHFGALPTSPPGGSGAAVRAKGRCHGGAGPFIRGRRCPPLSGQRDGSPLISVVFGRSVQSSFA